MIVVVVRSLQSSSVGPCIIIHTIQYYVWGVFWAAYLLQIKSEIANKKFILGSQRSHQLCSTHLCTEMRIWRLGTQLGIYTAVSISRCVVWCVVLACWQLQCTMGNKAVTICMFPTRPFLAFPFSTLPENLDKRPKTSKKPSLINVRPASQNFPQCSVVVAAAVVLDHPAYDSCCVTRAPLTLSNQLVLAQTSNHFLQISIPTDTVSI